MPEIKHTPTPYYATGVYVQSAIKNQDNFICEVEGDSREQAEANAAFIVKACNNHEESVEALKSMVDVGTEFYDMDCG